MLPSVYHKREVLADLPRLRQARCSAPAGFFGRA